MIWGGFLLGLAGSLHCAGMCGPIVLAIGKNTTEYQAIHHAGRIVAYILLGLGMGWGVSELPGQYWQSSWKILAALMLFALAFFQLFGTKIRIGFLYAIWRKLMGRVLKLPGMLRPALVGLAHGFLPCGLSFAAALTAGGFVKLSDSVLFMGLFGIGTLPALLGFQGVLAPFLANRKAITAVFLGLSAGWLMYMGISGLLMPETEIPANCHS